MHILITGRSGQLGQALAAVLAARGGYQITGWSLPEVDIADPQTVQRVAELAPDAVINTAAWTDVDGAERQPDIAYAANALAPKYVAEGCRACGAAMVQISTNEVFPGADGCVYREYDTPQPGGVYARSKCAGEQAARQTLDQLYIVRIAWLYGAGGNNFPAKILAAARRNGALRVVADEFGNPTYAQDVAVAIRDLLPTGRYGTYHLINEGCASRYELACAVLAQAGLADVPVTPIAASEWPRPVTPPRHAVLVNQAAAALGIRLRPWQAALAEFMPQLLRAES
jgi:dTDP-4-dehydrorhamnose reductase